MKRFIIALVIAMTASSADAISETLLEEPLKNAPTPTSRQTTIDGYFIVKFKDKDVHQSLRKETGERQTLGNKTTSFEHAIFDTFEAEHVRTLALGTDLIKVKLSDKSSDAIAIDLVNTGRFEFVEKMRVYYPLDFDSSEYNDPEYHNQSYFGDYSEDLKRGSGFAKMRASTVNNLGRKVRIAVIDSGSYRHEDVDFVGGYDFVTYEGFDEKGDINTVERDSDPTDEYFNETTGETCNVGHGLAVSSMIAAKANNGVGMVGAVDANMVEIIPVRALGCTGGSNTDIMEAVLWAAGESIEGVPDIDQPVDIVNMSLGGGANGGCPEWEQAVFDRLRELGVVVVVAAGNEDMNVVNSIPGACTRIVTVGSTDERGDKASFSNYGEKVDVSTFGTNVVGAFLSTTEDNLYTIGNGTSYSAPLVAATAASLLLKYPFLNPEQIESIIKSSTVDNSVIEGAQTVCGRRGCGTGILQANTAIKSISDAMEVSSYSVSHRYEGYDSAADVKWLDAMSSYVNACELVRYQWGNLGTEVQGITYNLFLTETNGERVELETVSIPQKVMALPQNATLSVQTCVNRDCGNLVEMEVSNLNYPAACSNNS